MKKSFIDNIPPMRSIPSNPFAFLWEGLYGFRFCAFLGLTSAFILSLSKILLSVFFSDMVEYFSQINPNNFSWQTICFYLLLMMASFFTTTIMRFIREYTESRFVRNKLRLKLSFFGPDYISKHSEGYMSSQKAGQISQKILGLRHNTQMLHIFISSTYSNVFLLMITFFYIGRVNLLFVLLTIIIGLISGIFSYKKSFILKNLSKETGDKHDQYLGTVVDSISNLITVKMFGKNQHELDVIMNKFDTSRQARISEINKMQNILTSQRALLAFFDITGAFLAIYLWYNQKIGVGDVALVLLLQGTAIQNFRRLFREISQINQGYGNLQSSLTPFLVKHEIVDAPNAKTLRVKNGAIKFENISFSYNEKNIVFKDFNLEIKAKEKIGIVGKSGSGKTTIINLLQHLYNPNNGKITIDNQNIANVTLASLANNIALIPQDTALFHRTLKQNIAYGKEGASEKEIISAAKKAHADEFIRELKRGYLSQVGEKGIKLSGGQRQRIAIARAILKNSPILILDEATSALDNESEQKITDSIQKLMKGKTVIAIAHRLSTLKEMDRIIVIDKGKIIEDGTPSELIDKQGKFAKLWKLQTD